MMRICARMHKCALKCCNRSQLGNLHVNHRGHAPCSHSRINQLDYLFKNLHRKRSTALSQHISKPSHLQSTNDQNNTVYPEENKRLHHEHYMRIALEQAQIAFDAGEVPVGAVIVSPTGDILATAHNTTETTSDPTAHAEMLCIRQAASNKDAWRLLDSTLYVTLEPCPMCAGALLQSRIGTVVYGARNYLLGADGSWIDMLRSDSSKKPHPFHPNLCLETGILEEECSQIMVDFFKKRRTSIS